MQKWRNFLIENKKPMAGKALFLPETIGSATGGLVLYCGFAMKRQLALACA